MTILTRENAKSTSLVRSISNPEWGTKAFNYNSQPLFNGKSASSVGRGFNSAVLFEDQFKFWEVIK